MNRLFALGRKSTNRIIAYDRALALAMIGMLMVNTKIIMSMHVFKPWWVDALVRFMTGRAAVVLFVMLVVAGTVIAHDRASKVGTS